MKTGYFWNEALSQRDTGRMCPEVKERNEVLDPKRLNFSHPNLNHFHFEALGSQILYSVHDESYIEYVKTAYSKKRRALDSGDTVVTHNTYEQALLSASGPVQAIDKIMADDIQRAFCVSRPPGHHANSMRAMGFCVFNNAAIAVRYLQRRHGIGKILIVDWDVHPGNGTQEIFWEDNTVFTLSFHQEDLFPESGRVELIGAGKGEGYNRNVPLPKKTDPKKYLDTFYTVTREVFQSFQPEFIIISCGLDAHKRDPSSDMLLIEQNYLELTNIIKKLAKPFNSGKILSILEGGYNLAALRDSVIAHIQALSE